MPVSVHRECLQCRHIAPTTLCARWAKVIQVLQKPATLGSPIDTWAAGNWCQQRDPTGVILAVISANAVEDFGKR